MFLTSVLSELTAFSSHGPNHPSTETKPFSSQQAQVDINISGELSASQVCKRFEQF